MIFFVGLSVHACFAWWDASTLTWLPPHSYIQPSDWYKEWLFNAWLCWHICKIKHLFSSKCGLLGTRLSSARIYRRWRHLLLSKMLPEVVTVQILNTWDSQQRASSLCPFLRLIRDSNISNGLKDVPTFTCLVIDFLPQRTVFSLGLKLCCLEGSACLLVIDVSSNAVYWANTVREFVSTHAHKASVSTVHPSSWALTWF